VNVSVTGGTGVLGRPVVRRLVAAGHEVRVAVRSEASAARARRLGASPVVVDLFDADGVARAVEGAHAVLHLATRIPAMTRAHRPHAWDENNRLRTETTRLLAAAAAAAGADTLVAESITFVYRDRGAEWIDETAPLAPGPLASVVDLEQAVAGFAVAGRRGVSLRFGSFYGPEARSIDEAVRAARRRVAPVLGRPDAYTSAIHTDDAATAVVAALGVGSGAYNVVDDAPLTRRAFADAFAAAFGLRRLHLVGPRLASVVGGRASEVLARSQRVSNARFRAASGWTPAHPDAREGWAAVAASRAAAVGAAGRG
jgi:nucleoside-diphosphate-sugar epimerase